MPTGYTRQSAAEIVTGQTINASSFNNEFNAIQAAMDVSAGHTHDGTVGGGAPITLTTSVTGILPIANGGTNASTAAGARTNLGLTIGTNVQAYDAGLQSISGLTTAANKMIYTTALDTYAVTDLTAAGRALLDDADATAQRTTLGLGTLSTQNANSVSVTGGTITGITDLAIADGGTGASDAATARTNLGLAIGTNVQAYDPALQSISGLTTAANQLIYTTASDTYAVTGLTAAGRAILDDADAAAQRATLGLGTIATQNASSVSVTDLTASGDITIADKIIHSGDIDTSIRFPAVDTVTVETGGVERLRVASGGNVGIGTTSPAVKLHVSSSYTSPTGGIDAGIQCAVTNTAGYSGLQILSGNTQAAYIHLGDTDDADRGAIIYDHSGDFLRFDTNAAERMRITSTGQVGIGTTPSEQLHITGNFRIGSAVQATPSGSAPLYAARAWVNFNGTGTVAIRASGNVTSITDNNTGDYTVNFTTAMPDANYCVVVTVKEANTNSQSVSVGTVAPTGMSTISARVVTSNVSQAATDMVIANVAIFR